MRREGLGFSLILHVSMWVLTKKLERFRALDQICQIVAADAGQWICHPVASPSGVEETQERLNTCLPEALILREGERVLLGFITE